MMKIMYFAMVLAILACGKQKANSGGDPTQATPVITVPEAPAKDAPAATVDPVLLIQFKYGYYDITVPGPLAAGERDCSLTGKIHQSSFNTMIADYPACLLTQTSASSYSLNCLVNGAFGDGIPYQKYIGTSSCQWNTPYLIQN